MVRNFLAVAGLLVFALTCTNVNAQMGKIDTKHVSDESFCVVRLDLGRVAGQLKESRKLFERMSKEFKEEAGLELSELQALTLQFGKSDIDDGDPSFAVTFEFSAKVDKDKFLKEVLGRRNFSEETVNGNTYLKPDSKHDPHVYFESDQKFTMATPGAIKNILNAGGGMGRMSAQIKSAPPGSEFIAVFEHIEGFEKSLTDLTEEFKELPIPLELHKLLGKGRSGMAYLNMASSNPVFVKLEMDSAETAKELHTGLKGSIDLAKLAVPTSKAYVAGQLKELEDAEGFDLGPKAMMKMAQKGLVISEKLLGGLTMKANGKTIEINVRHMGGITELADLFASGVMTTIFGFGRTVEPADIEGLKERAATIDEAKKK